MNGTPENIRNFTAQLNKNRADFHDFMKSVKNNDKSQDDKDTQPSD